MLIDGRCLGDTGGTAGGCEYRSGDATYAAGAAGPANGIIGQTDQLYQYFHTCCTAIRTIFITYNLLPFVPYANRSLIYASVKSSAPSRISMTLAHSAACWNTARPEVWSIINSVGEDEGALRWEWLGSVVYG